MRYLVAFLLTSTLAWAGMSSLRVMPGVREAAMGNVGVASASGPQAIAWNPAAGAEIQGFALRAGYAKWLLDSHQQSVFLVRNFGFASLGIGVTSMTAGRFEYRTEVPTEDPVALFSPSEFGFHVGMSKTFARIVSTGVAARFYYTKILDDEASAPGVDLGVRVKPMDQLSLGISLTDFGRNLVYVRESFRLPTRARLGASFSQDLGAGFGASVAADAGLYVYTKRFNAQAGLELDWNRTLFVRSGWEWLGENFRPAGGLGIALGKVQFDYALTALNDNLGTAHRVSIALGR